MRRKAEDALGKSVSDLIDWEEDGSLLARLFKVAQTGEAMQFIYHAPVSARHFAVSAYRSTPKQLVIDLKDISAAINAEEALAKSEIKYRQLFELSINGFALHEMVFDKEGKPFDFRFLDVNSAFEEHTGIKRENVIGKLGSEVLPGIEKTDLFEIYSNVAITGKAQRFETFYESLNRHFLILAFSPEINHFATIFMDFTERLQANKILEESELNFRTLFNSNAAGLLFIRMIRGGSPGRIKQRNTFWAFLLKNYKGSAPLMIVGGP